ncbi:unnamed protein product, partial [Penicillium salamii]
RSSIIPVAKVPFIYSKTEELVWKWEQSKLCGQSINITLSTTMIPEGHPPNKSDSRGEFLSIQNGVVHVFPQAQLPNLKPHDYQIGILEAALPANAKIILLGAKKTNQKKDRRGSLIRLQHSLLDKGPHFNSWSTEFWVSDSVVIDSKSIEEAGPDAQGIASREASTRQDISTNHSVSSMLKRMSGKSWLVRAKLMFTLERSGRERAAILAELLEVSHIQVTSSHKPITHS